MTRWWTYAVLAIALLAGSVRAQAAPDARVRCELRESANAAASTARKRSAKVLPIARPETLAAPLALVPDRFRLAAPARACTLVVFAGGAGHAAVRPVRAAARAPPRS